MSKYIGATVVNLSVDTVDVTGDITATDATPEVIIVNDTHEDTEGGREGKVTFKGQQSGGEETTLAEIQASHDGTSDDQKGDLIFRTNDGSDDASPTERIRIDSNGHVGVNTSSPDANGFGSGNGILTVASDTGSAKTAMLNLVGDGNDTDATRVASLFFNDASATGAGSTLAGVEAYRASNHATDPGADLVFSTNTGSTGSYAEAMRIDNNGYITKPKQCAFFAEPASNQNDIPINGNTTVVWGTEIFDIGSNFASNVFTAPITGKYQFNVKLNFINVDIDFDYINVYFNASNRFAVYTFGAGAGDIDTYQTVAFSTLMDMDANDQAWVYINLPNQGAAQMDVSTDSKFSGYLVA